MTIIFVLLGVLAAAAIAAVFTLPESMFEQKRLDVSRRKLAKIYDA